MGFIHGDPHPGNLLKVTEGPHAGKLALLDFGLVAEIPLADRCSPLRTLRCFLSQLNITHPNVPLDIDFTRDPGSQLHCAQIKFAMRSAIPRLATSAGRP